MAAASVWGKKKVGLEAASRAEVPVQLMRKTNMIAEAKDSWHLNPKLIIRWISGDCCQAEAMRFAYHRENCANCDRQFRLVFWFAGFDESSSPVANSGACMSANILGGFATGSLCEEEKNIVSEHLSKCSDCRVELEMLMYDGIPFSDRGREIANHRQNHLAGTRVAGGRQIAEPKI